MIHDGFYCTRRYAATTRWPPVPRGQLGGLAARSVNSLFKAASLPCNSTRPSRQASGRFRHEPSWIMRVHASPRSMGYSNSDYPTNTYVIDSIQEQAYIHLKLSSARDSTMDSSRLLAVLNDIEADYNEGLGKLLPALVLQYTTARDSPTTDNAPAIQKAFTALVQFVDTGRFSQYPPSKTSMLQTIQGDDRVGPGLKERLNALLSVQGQTTAGIVTALTALQKDIDTFRKSCVQAKTGLEALGLSPHKISLDGYEVGVLIPQTLVDSKLSPLIKELGNWNTIVRGFQEVAGEDEREVTVVGLAIGSYELYLPLGIIAAEYLSRAIDKILEWYLKVLEIRKHRLQLKELEAPTAEVASIQKHEKEIIEKGIQALVKEIVREAQPKADTERKQELETLLTISIRQITRFVDRGGTVEVDSTQEEEPAEPPPMKDDATSTEKAEYEKLLGEYKKLNTRFQKTNKILESGRALRQLPARPEPILQIEDGAEVAEAPAEKHLKKRSEKSS